jgi:hypothetical protein
MMNDDNDLTRNRLFPISQPHISQAASSPSLMYSGPAELGCGYAVTENQGMMVLAHLWGAEEGLKIRDKAVFEKGNKKITRKLVQNR